MYFCSHFYFICEIIIGETSRHFVILASKLHETFKRSCRVRHIHVALADDKQTDFSECFSIFGKKIVGRRLKLIKLSVIGNAIRSPWLSHDDMTLNNSTPAYNTR